MLSARKASWDFDKRTWAAPEDPTTGISQVESSAEVAFD